MTSMQSISATEFKAKCLDILDHVPAEGLVITKRGKSVARLYPESQSPLRFLGTMPDIHVEGDLLSTGVTWELQSEQ